MFRNRVFAVVLTATSLMSWGAVAEGKKPKEIWSVTEGLDTPESAYYDPLTRSIFVSNIGGDPTKKDGQGWISKIDENGKVLAAQWVAGLDAPKGLRSYKDTLWVADIDRLHAISVSKASIIQTFTLPGAKFLNDVAIDTEGNVYVSDMFDNKIYRTSAQNGRYQQPEVYLQGEDELINPNGLLVHKGELIIGRWGRPIKPDFSTDSPGSLAFAKLGSKVSRQLPPLGNIDGIELLNKNELIVSDFVAGKIYRVQLKSGKAELILTEKSGTADIGLIPARKILLVPLFSSVG